MSTATAEKQPTQISQLSTMQAIVAGKVTSTRAHQGKVYTTIIIPVQDEFSSPEVVEVRSKGRIADDEQVVRIKCRVGGFLGKQFNVVDSVTGQQRSARQCKVTLDLVEQ